MPSRTSEARAPTSIAPVAVTTAAEYPADQPRLIRIVPPAQVRVSSAPIQPLVPRRPKDMPRSASASSGRPSGRLPSWASPSGRLRYRLRRPHCSVRVSGKAMMTACWTVVAPRSSESGPAQHAIEMTASTKASASRTKCSSARGLGTSATLACGSRGVEAMIRRPVASASAAGRPLKASRTTAASSMSCGGRPSRASTT